MPSSLGDFLKDCLSFDKLWGIQSSIGIIFFNVKI